MVEAVNVVIRFRAGETGPAEDFANWNLSDTTIRKDNKDYTFNFDAVLDAGQSQEETYEKSGRKLVNSFMDGFNGTIFAYGQSGSGKTFTMLGPEEVTEVLVNEPEKIPDIAEMFGVIPRCTFQIFEIINEGQNMGIEYSMECSYVEIYNEAINDLLCSPPNLNLRLREFPNLGMCIVGVVQQKVQTAEEIFELISLATKNRIVCATGQNARSSRGHTVFVLTMEQKMPDGSSKVSKLNLVDLAGSEKLSKTGATGKALEEAKNINQSLTTLSRCISALTSKKATHIPYRESKLTLILKESLGGNAKTTLICTGSKRKIHQEETLSTLKFAERAKMVKNSAKSNAVMSVDELQRIVKKQEEEIKSLKRKLASKDGKDPDAVEEEVPSGEFMELKVKHEKLMEAYEMKVIELNSALEKAEKGGGDIDYLSMHEEMEAYRERIDELTEQANNLGKQKEEQRLMNEHVVEQLELSSKELEKEMDALTERNDELIQKNEEFKTTVDQKEQETFDLKQELDKVRREKDELEYDIEQSKQSALSMTEKKNALEEQILIIKKELEDAYEAKKKDEETIKNNKQNIDDLTHRMITLEEQHGEYETTIEKLAKEKTELKESESSLKAESSTLRSQINELNSKLETEQHSYTQELFLLQSKIKQSELEITSLNQILKESDSAKTVLEEREGYISELNKNYQEIISKSKAENEQLSSMLVEAHKKSDEQSQREIELINEKEKVQMQLKTTNEKYNKAVSQLVEHKQDNNDLEERLREQEKKTEELKESLDKQTLQESKLNSQVAEAKTEIEALNNSLKLAEETTSALRLSSKTAADKLSEELQTTNKALFDKEKELKEILSKLESSEKANAFEVKEMKNSLQEKDVEMHKLKNKNNTLEGELNQAKIKIDQLQAEVKQKEKERMIERKTSLARQTIGLNKRPSVFASKPSQLNFNQGGGGGNPWVTLKSTGSKYLQDAIEEAKVAATLAPQSEFTVNYGMSEIRAMYGNIDEYAHSVPNDIVEEDGEEEKDQWQIWEEEYDTEEYQNRVYNEDTSGYYY